MDPDTGQFKAPESKPGAKADTKDELKSLHMTELQAESGASPGGLTQAEAEKRLTQYGPNAIEEKKANPFLKFLTCFWGPIPRMIEAARVFLDRVIADRNCTCLELKQLARFPDENCSPVLSISGNGILLYANESSAPLLSHEGMEAGMVVPATWRTWMGEARDTGCNKEVELDCNGQVFALVFAQIANSDNTNVYGTDISERKNMEKILRQSEAEMRCILETSIDGVLAATANGKVIRMNQRFGEMWHFSKTLLNTRDDHAMLNAILSQLVNPEAFQQKVKALYRSNEKDMDTVAFKDGRMFERYSAPLLMPDSSAGRVWFFRDITERQQAEHDLLASETRYRRLFESAKDGILILDADTGAIVDVNPFLVALLGYDRKHILGKKLWELGFFSDVVASKAAFLDLQEDAYIRFDDLPLRAKDGRQVIVEFVSNVYWADSVKVIQCNIRDVTERKGLEEQLRQAQKMESIGQLAGGVAHDFNNILQAISGYSSLLLDCLPAHGETHEFAEEIARGAERAAALTRQLLIFSRRQILDREDLDINETVNGIAKMIRRLIGEDIELEFVEAHRLGNIYADRGQMEQVLINLCVNARDAMPEGGIITIETEDTVMDNEYCEVHIGASPGRYVLLSVTDTGCGMNAQTQASIFEPFFTTKESGKGTGLGLSTVHGIVRQHQGMVQVYSEVGKGTSFKVFLPTTERAAEAVAARTARYVKGGTETILLAEDDEALQKLAERILKDAGYSVLLAANGEEALAVFAKHAADIDLCLLDIVMPKMGGKAVYDILHQQNPPLRFLFSSGYSTSAIHARFLPEEGIELIQKPYAPAALLRRVR